MRLSTGLWTLWLTWLAVGESYEPKVVCYFQGQAVTRLGYANFEISDIDLTLCTHLIYATVDSSEDGEVRVLFPKTDLPDNGGLDGFRKFNALRKRDGKLKTLLSIRNNEYLFSQVGTNSLLRSKYVKNVVDFVVRHEFDGLDIFWLMLGIRDDIPDYVPLLEELRASLHERNLLLSIHVAGPEIHARWYYDIPGISEHVDFITLDIECRQPTDSTTGHVAPLYPGSRTTSSVDLTLNTNATVHYWLSEGVPAEKLILGIRFWGTRYTLKNPAEHGLGSPTIVPPPYSYDLDPVGYNEICRLTSQDSWTTVWDEEQHAPYSYSENQWITYDNVRSAIEKGKYAKALGLGGVMAWSIDIDDHRSTCGRRNPILNAMNCGIREIGCSPVSAPEAPTTTKIPDRMTSGSVLPSVDAKIVCYYPNSAAIAVGYESMVPSEIDPTLCTHLIYASIGITEDGGIRDFAAINLADNGGLGGFQKFNALRKRNDKLKTLLSARWGFYAAKYSEVAANNSLRVKYVKNVVEFVRRHEFDGFDIDWYSSTNDGYVPKDLQNFLLLLKELRASFDEHKLLLSVQLDGTEFGARTYSDIPQIAKYVDFISLLCAYPQGSDQVTGHLEPLYPPSGETSSYDLTLNVNASINYWLDKGAPAEKLILSAWFFGISYTLNNPADHSRGSPARVANGPGDKSARIGYNQICRLSLQDDAWTTVWDEEERVPYTYLGNRWISYDDVRSLTEKALYVKAMGLGGILAYNIDQDDHRGDCRERNPLLKALNCALREINCTSVSTPEYSTSTKISSGGTFPTNPIAEKIASEAARRTCATRNTKYVRHSENCARFWICRKIRENEFKAEPFSCGAGLYFDTSKISCRSKNLVKCY